MVDIVKFIEELGGEILYLDEEVKTVKQAAKATGVSESDIIKSLIFMSRDEPILVIVQGDSKVDIGKLEKIIGKVRLAKPDEVVKATGYRIGEVPPVGVKIKTIIDKKILDKDFVVGGGGSLYRLCRIPVREIIRVQRPLIEDIT